MKEVTKRNAPVIPMRNLPMQETQPALQKKHRNAPRQKKTIKAGSIEMTGSSQEIGERTGKRVVKTSEIPAEQKAAMRAQNIGTGQLVPQASQAPSLKEVIQRSKEIT